MQEAHIHHESFLKRPVKEAKEIPAQSRISDAALKYFMHTYTLTNLMYFQQCAFSLLLVAETELEAPPANTEIKRAFRTTRRPTISAAASFPSSPREHHQENQEIALQQYQENQGMALLRIL